MTQLESAKQNTLTRAMKIITAKEPVSAGDLLKKIRNGRVVIPLNKNHKIQNICAIGEGLRTKINANIGTSTDASNIREELKKLDIAVGYKADTIMDLSVGGEIKEIRKEILKRSTVPVGTVPIYEIAVNASRKRKNLLSFGPDEILETLENQARDGVDFFTIHAGVTIKSLAMLKKEKRVLGIVSRGGAIIAAWIKKNKRENPFYEYFDEIIDICNNYDVTISLGDGLRPGSIFDATDKGQVAELKILGELALRSQKKGVQVMIEGPGHVPLNEIKKNVELEKKLCHGAPFYVLGPLVTDIACGYDHINASIGGALAASYGADFLCYVTPSEHLRHPSVADVREGVIAFKIAAHAADIAKGISLAKKQDKDISLARRKRDWQKQIKLSIDPQKAREYRESSKPKDPGVCTMCGEYCSIKLFDECMRA